ncbi:MAG: ShlB/FhaC/HecB family hemolysin secretion/activation protein [Gammaproteobacteria bacterium]|nr:ShlB/FhaC/HecB family hemolysin secretion/activation protein [Gammaproteobacteria bacterium]
MLLAPALPGAGEAAGRLAEVVEEPSSERRGELSGRPPPAVRVLRFVVDGPDPLGEQATRALLEPLAEDVRSLDDLRAVADRLQQALAGAGHAFHRVLLPPQTIRDGVVRLQVVPFEVGDIKVSGNTHFSDANVRRSLPALKLRSSPQLLELRRDIAVANRHPAKQVDVTFSDDQTRPRSLQATVTVRDRKPWTVFTALDNAGNSQTGRLRWTLGGQHTNLFDLDHTLYASFTTAPGHGDRVRQWAASYRVPLYGYDGSLTAYWLRSDVDSGRVLEVLDVSGRGQFLGLRLSHTLSSGSWSSRLRLGVEDRHFDQSVLAGTVNLARDVRSRPITVGYEGELLRPGWRGAASIEYVRNLPWGQDNDGTAYAANRVGAQSTWDLVRVHADASAGLGDDWTLRGHASVQIANEPLIPGEQFGLGGQFSVRGLQERALSGDSGVQISAELWSPAIPGTFGARLLGFADTGQVSLKNGALANGRRSERLTSIGMGTRWQWRDLLSVSFDLARVIDGRPQERGVRGHLNLLLRH